MFFFCICSPSSTASSLTSRWLRSHRKSAMLEGNHSNSTISGSTAEALSNTSNLTGISNWYEMTETSRFSEGDESISDFSICHPNPSSATNALVAAVGVNSTKIGEAPPQHKTSQNPKAEPTIRLASNGSVVNRTINCSSSSVGNSSSFQRATSFEGAFSALSNKGI